MSGLSDFERMRNERLPNWRRWGSQDAARPDPETGTGSIYQLGRADRQGEGEDLDALPDLPPPPINVPDAEWLDGLITRHLPLDHRHTICRYYGSFYRAPDMSVRHRIDAAVRALLDCEYANEARRA